MTPEKVPHVVFKTRVRDESIGGDNPFKWQDTTSDDLFKGKKVIVFALPGAFTPTCSSTHLPRYEELYDEFEALGVDEIYCLSVNDAFVMSAWAADLGVEKVTLLPDGNGDFSRRLGMLDDGRALGLGERSRRYAMVLDDGVIEKLFVEEEGPLGSSDASEADAVLAHLRRGAREPGASLARAQLGEHLA